MIVTAIPRVGEGQGTDEDLADALRAAASAHPAKPVAVAHVELGGLAEALSEAVGTGPRADNAQARPRTPAPHAAPAASAPRPASADAPTPAAAPAPAETLAAAVRIPAYPATERAVRALGEAVKYAQWRREAADPGRVPEFDGVDSGGAAELIGTLLGAADDDPSGFTLPDEAARELLARYGIGVHTTLPAPTPDEAVAAAQLLGYPVALKATAPHLRHRADLGGVRLDLADEDQLRRSYTELSDSFGRPTELRPVVQAMAPRGVDTVVRAVIDPVAGAVLSFGLAGAASELLGDTAHRLIPVTDRDARSVVRAIRTAPVLFGWRGSAPADTDALEELLLRVSLLVDEHPEVVGITLEPVVVAQHGLSVLSASVRLAHPPARDDLGPRTLPAY